MNEFVPIDALKLTDYQVTLLSWARHLNLTSSDPTLDRLAGGGAQMIWGFGRDQAVQDNPEGLFFQLTPEAHQTLNGLFADPDLSTTVTYAGQLLAEPSDQTNAQFLEVVSAARTYYATLKARRSS